MIKTRVRSFSLFSSLLLVSCASPSAALDRSRLAQLNTKFRQFAKAHDLKSARSTLEEIARELPAITPRHMLRMASVEAQLGDRREAIGWLRRYAATGLKYDVENDPELKSLVKDRSARRTMSEMATRTKPVSTGEVECELPLADLMPEDISFDDLSQRFIVSSIQHHTLYRARLSNATTKECTLEEVQLPDEVKKWPVMAVSVDAKRGLVWMTTSALEGFAGVSKADSGKTALIALALTTGNIIRRLDLQSNTAGAFGDMFVGSDGSVYVSDSVGGGVYRVRGDVHAAQLEKIADGLFSPQTPVLASDHKRLFVPDYPVGIAMVELAGAKKGRVTYLPHPDDVATVGLDGLYLAGSSLIGIQNGTEPERIVLYQLNDAQTKIISARVIEQGPRIGEPTHAVAVGRTFYVSANVGWDKVDDQGKLKPGEEFTRPVLLRFTLH